MVTLDRWAARRWDDSHVVVAALAVGAHFVATAAHGAAHGLIPVGLTPTQVAVVVAVLGVGPVAALWVISAGRYRLGGALLAASMAGSLAVGVTFHFVLATPDHVHAVPTGPWHDAFAWTAVLGALVDAAGLLAGVWVTASEP